MLNSRGSRWVSFALSIFLAASTGCSPSSTSEQEADPIGQGIRSFDFGNAAWLDYPISLGEGLNQFKLDSGRYRGKVYSRFGSNEEYRYELAGVPVFADVDGDGDDDAAVALRSVGLVSHLSWYLWTWQDGSAYQLHYPFYRRLKCDAAQTTVEAAEGRFKVSTFLGGGSDACADPPTKREQYVVGVQDGYPVRVSPTRGAPDKDCSSVEMRAVVATNPGAAKAAPEMAAPEVEQAKARDRIEVLSRESYQPFILARLTAGGLTYCGWIRRSVIE
ncbi:hypothetical protein AB0D32_20090 [Micromonospora sp. NPDC048170]|uniref:hypothetical protein n=1 Tax=Micromonospora sp. NPDC048170 TaxID=3154819 RepID=UPI0033EACD4F